MAATPTFDNGVRGLTHPLVLSWDTSRNTISNAAHWTPCRTDCKLWCRLPESECSGPHRLEIFIPFLSWRQYKKFAEFVTKRFRHVLDDENQAFVAEVLETSKKRVRVLPKGTCLWRAQLGFDIRNEEQDSECLIEQEINKWPHPPKRMVPQPDRAYEGRVNPKGLPCLYCATERETAMTEVRPWCGAYVSVAQLITERDLRLVDCSKEWSPEQWKVDLFMGDMFGPDPLSRAE